MVSGIIALPSLALAQSLTIQGKLVDSGGNPVNGSATIFRVQILSPNANRCVLYDESQTLDLSTTNGLFSVNLNSGSGTVNAPATYNLEQAVSNRAGFNVASTYCATGSGTVTYTPNPDDARKVVIQFRDPATMSSYETIPEMDLNPVAYAIESRTIGGYGPSAILRVANSGTPGVAPILSSAQVTELQALIGGSSTNYMSSTTGSTTGARLPTVSGNPASPSPGSIWFDTATGAMKYYDGSTVQTVGSGGGGGGGGTITSITAGGALTGGGSSGAVTVSLPTTGVTGFGSAVGSASSVPVITYDSYGRLTAVSSAAIAGTLPSGTSGQFLKSSGGSTWAGASITMADLKSTIGGAALFSAPGCSASQALYWDSGTDQLKCQAIAVGNSNISDLAWGKITGVPNLVANAGGTPSLLTDIEANLPTVHVNGRIFIASDTKKLFRDNGTTWDQLAVAPNAVVNALGTASITTGPTASQPTGQVAGRLFINTTTQKISYDNGTAWIDVASNGGSGFTGSLSGEVSGTQSATQVDSINGINRSTITSNLNAVINATDAASASQLVKRDASGDFSGRKITASEVIVKGSVHTASLTADPSADYSLKLPDNKASMNGQLLSSDTNGVLSWASPSSSFGSIAVNPPVTNTSGTIGMPSANTSRDGYLTQADWNTFSGKLSSALNSALIWVGNGSNVAAPVAPSGNVSLDNAGKFTVTGIRDQAISAAGTNVGQVLRYSAPDTWTPQFLTMKDLRSTVNGSQALTSSCTAGKTMYWDSATDSLACQDISIAAATQISGQLPIANGGTGTNSAGQNLVFAGPATGGAGAPSFRALTSADLPAGASLWTLTSGNIHRDTGFVGVGTTSPSYDLHVNGTAATQIALSSTGASGRTYSLQSTGGTSTALDGYFQIVDRTANSARMLIDASGKTSFANSVGIGTTGPTQPLDVRGGIRAANTDFVPTTAGSFVDLGLGTSSGDTYSKLQAFIGGGNTAGVLSLNPLGGNVGIGTTTAGQRLSVNGVIESISGGVKFPDGTVQTTATTNGVIDGLVLAFSSGLSTSSACPAYVDIPGTSKSVTFANAGNFIVNWSFGYYGNGGYTGGMARVCVGTTCGGDMSFYANEGGSHKWISGSWVPNIAAGTRVVKLQLCYREGSGIVMDGNDAASWVVHAGTGAGGGGGADNLGNHTATQNIILGSNWLSGDGDPEGIRILSDGKVGVGISAPTTKLQVGGTLKLGDGNESCTATADGGMIRYNSTSIQFCDGSSWKILSSSAPTFSLNTTGSVANWGNVGSAFTLNLPMASTAGALSGLLSNTDYVAFSGKASLASPTFTGTPAAPTAAADTNTTQLATTAFVLGQAATTTPVMDGTGAVGTSLRYARADHVHPTDTSRAPAGGSSSITQVGTISSGTWNGTAIGVPYGGTGLTTGTVGAIPYFSATNAMTALAAGTNGYILTSNGPGVAPSWQAAASNAVNPAGMVSAFPMASCPTGWLEANGAAVSRTTYASLYTAVGVLYGSGDGSTTFNLPDYRGYFLRGWNHAGGSDPDVASRTNRGDGTTGDAVGTKQDHQLSSHNHPFTDGADWRVTAGSGSPVGGVSGGNYSGNTNRAGVVGYNGGSETRPKNINVIYCISTATAPVTTVASTGSGTANYLPKWSSTTGLGNSNIYDSGSSVGIGTSNPSAATALDVKGIVQIGTNSASSSNIVLEPSGSNQSFLRFTADSLANYIQSGISAATNSAKDLRFTAALTQTPWMMIQGSTGNVGIGTTNPGFGLDARSASVALGPVMQVYAASSVSWANGVYQKIPFNTVEFDPDSSFDTTNNRFRPQKAGYYRIVANLQYQMTATGAFTLSTYMNKNATTVKQIYQLINYNAGFSQTMTIQSIVYLNGTTDYVEIFGFSNSGTPQVVGGGNSTWISADFVRSGP